MWFYNLVYNLDSCSVPAKLAVSKVEPVIPFYSSLLKKLTCDTFLFVSSKKTFYFHLTTFSSPVLRFIQHDLPAHKLILAPKWVKLQQLIQCSNILFFFSGQHS